MKKLNNKGYITVEIIIASVITFAIAFFLIDITANVVSDTDDAYVETVLLTDKALIIKNIKKCIKEEGRVTSVSYDSINKQYEIDFAGHSASSILKLENNNNKYILKYIDGTNKLVYSKELDSSLSGLSLTGGKYGDYVYFKITADNIFSEQNNDINIIVYNG